MYLRVFLTAVDPADVATLGELFTEDVLPVFTQLAGCASVELALSVEANAGGLVEAAAISRWESPESMEAALVSRPARESQVRIFELLRQEPVIRVFEVVGGR